MGRRLACSDIHGEGHRLLQVLKKAHYEPGKDRLFLLGDYLDRGTDSKRTMEIVFDLWLNHKVVVLGGNHEHMCAIAMQAHFASDPKAAIADWYSQGGRKTMQDYADAMPTGHRDLITVLATSSDHLYHEEPDCILVHAGLKPGVPLPRQNPDDLLWIRREFHNNYRGKRVIFGHCPTFWITGDSNFFDVWHGPDKTGIDTGAAYGGPLTLYDLDTHQTWWA